MDAKEVADLDHPPVELCLQVGHNETPLLDAIRSLVRLVCPLNFVRRADLQHLSPTLVNPNSLATLNNVYLTPYLAVGLFVLDRFDPTGARTSALFQRKPWLFHHKVEVTNRQNVTVARQEFHQLASDLPLWSASTVIGDYPQLRFTLFCRNFPAMIDFYRVITGREIECGKPGFCLFALGRVNNVELQLSLKESPQLIPYQLGSACLRFEVNDGRLLSAFFGQSQFEALSSGDYLTRDPDGNMLLVHDLSSHLQRCVPAAFPLSISDTNSFSSHDSGRYSDQSEDRLRAGECDVDSPVLDVAYVDDIPTPVLELEDAAARRDQLWEQAMHPRLSTRLVQRDDQKHLKSKSVSDLIHYFESSRGRSLARSVDELRPRECQRSRSIGAVRGLEAVHQQKPSLQRARSNHPKKSVTFDLDLHPCYYREPRRELQRPPSAQSNGQPATYDSQRPAAVKKIDIGIKVHTRSRAGPVLHLLRSTKMPAPRPSSPPTTRGRRRHPHPAAGVGDSSSFGGATPRMTAYRRDLTAIQPVRL